MYGMDDNGFTIKRLPEIKLDLEEAARKALGSDASLLPDSIEGAIISEFSRIYSEIWEEMYNAWSAFNPNVTTGQALDNISLLNGLMRNPPLKSRAFISIIGVDNTVIPAGSIIRHIATNAEFLTETSVEIGVSFPTGTATVFVSARFDGAIEALAGTLTVIGSPVNGWTSAINNTDAVKGQLAETDAQLRARRARSLALAGSASLEAIVSGVQKIANVTFAGAVENFTDAVDGNGLNAHSFNLIALGGDDVAIAQTIWEKKPIGIEAFGSTNVVVNDIFGQPHSISFTRPTSIPIYLNVTLSFLGKTPDDAGIIITQSILDYVAGSLISGQGLTVGDDVINSRMYFPINLAFPDITINLLEMGLDGVVYNTSDILIAFNELSAWDATRIVVTVA